MHEPSGLTELVTAAANGDPEAWNAIVERFSSLLWSVGRAHRLSMEDAADVVQNTWLRLLDHRPIQQPEALPGWLATTARHECLSLLRRRGRDVLVRDDLLGPMLVDEEAASLDAASRGREGRPAVDLLHPAVGAVPAAAPGAHGLRPAELCRGVRLARHAGRLHRPHPHALSLDAAIPGLRHRLRL